MKENIIEIKENITIEDVIKISRYNKKVILSEKCIERIENSNKVLNLLKDKDKLYGINTGLGELCDQVIKDCEQEKYQENIILSHAVGCGESYTPEIIRAAMVILINSIAKGNSGTRLCVVEKLLELLNRGITPIVPSKGSLGASGDLVPLSHMALPLIGYGNVYYEGKVSAVSDLIEQKKFKKIELDVKEALSLINGTHFMLAVGIFLIAESKKVMNIADYASALTCEALGFHESNFNEYVHSLRPHSGQIEVANRMRIILYNSTNNKKNNGKIQDGYSIRCIPQIHGASLDTLKFVENIVETELNSVTDNPVVFTENKKIISTGNFHGQYLALGYDFLCIALSELCNVSERRIERLVNPTLSGLPAFLINNPGVNNGLMIAQYTAASLVSENKVLSHPASVDSIPSSANQEDHVSMGSISSRKCLDILNNLFRVLSIEFLCNLQALDLSDNIEKTSIISKEIYNYIRKDIDFISEDRLLYVDIDVIESILKKGKLNKKIEKIIGTTEIK